MCLRIPLEVSFWIQTIFCQCSYVGMLVLTYDKSAIRQDPNLFLLEVDSMDPVVSIHHHHTPAIGYFSKLCHLAILSNSIKPWPMTLAPTNEAIRCEIMQKKTLWVKKRTTMIREYHG
jgi:hypothetical protein